MTQTWAERTREKYHLNQRLRQLDKEKEEIYLRLTTIKEDEHREAMTEEAQKETDRLNEKSKFAELRKLYRIAKGYSSETSEDDELPHELECREENYCSANPDYCPDACLSCYCQVNCGSYHCPATRP